ncbi:MAG: hypothetical protein J7L39_03345 [Candidatus Aenigmarchaeota archaeon]|nr:hypothetical protein [Candidatus Aenigmarchaeota archaeon]
MEIKDVIILGAGTSKSEGAPLQNQLFKEFLEYYEQVLKGEEWHVLGEQEEQIVDYFKRFWGIDVHDTNNSEFPTFEECLGVLDLAYSRGESFKGLSREEIENIRNALIFLIATVLDTKLERKIVHHKKLVERLKQENKLKETAFISLNYDIIIDNVLVDQYPDYHLDYGIDFVNFKRRNDNWREPEEEKSVLLLKIHGSLNWLYCPTCNHIELTPKRKGAIKAFYKVKNAESVEH